MVPSSFPCRHLLLCVDYFSNFCWGFKCKDLTAELYCSQIQTLWQKHGPWKRLQSDNGGAFVAICSKELYKSLGVQHITSRARHPRTATVLIIFATEDLMYFVFQQSHRAWWNVSMVFSNRGWLPLLLARYILLLMVPSQPLWKIYIYINFCSM